MPSNHQSERHDSPSSNGILEIFCPRGLTNLDNTIKPKNYYIYTGKTSRLSVIHTTTFILVTCLISTMAWGQVRYTSPGKASAYLGVGTARRWRPSEVERIWTRVEAVRVVSITTGRATKVPNNIQNIVKSETRARPTDCSTILPERVEISPISTSLWTVL